MFRWSSAAFSWGEVGVEGRSGGFRQKDVNKSLGKTAGSQVGVVVS